METNPDHTCKPSQSCRLVKASTPLRRATRKQKLSESLYYHQAASQQRVLLPERHVH
jgi:hypothetical protein